MRNENLPKLVENRVLNLRMVIPKKVSHQEKLFGQEARIKGVSGKLKHLCKTDHSFLMKSSAIVGPLKGVGEEVVPCLDES